MSHYVIINATTTSVPVLSTGDHTSQYLVPTGASGDWASQAGKIARADGEAGYIYITLKAGDTIHDTATRHLYFYDATRSKVLSDSLLSMRFKHGTGATGKLALNIGGNGSQFVRELVVYDLTFVGGAVRAHAGTITDCDCYLSLDDTTDLTGTAVNFTSSGTVERRTDIDVDADAGDSITAYFDDNGNADSVNNVHYVVFYRRRLYPA